MFVRLFVRFPQLVKFIGDIQSRENRNLARIDREGSGRNFAHALIDVLGKLLEIFRVAIGPDRVSLIVNLDSYTVIYCRRRYLY